MSGSVLLPCSRCGIKTKRKPERAGTLCKDCRDAVKRERWDWK